MHRQARNKSQFIVPTRIRGFQVQYCDFGASSQVIVYGHHCRFPKNTSSGTVRAATSANTDQTQRCIHFSSIAGLDTFRWSKFSLLSHPAADLIRMIVLVFSDSTFCFGVSISDPSIQQLSKLEDVWNEHGFVDKFNLAARGVQFICRLHNAKEVAAFAEKFKPGHWCFLWLASEGRGGTENMTNPHGQRDSIALPMVDIKCHTSHPFSSDRTIIAWMASPLPRHISEDHVGKQSTFFTIEFASGMRLKSGTDTEKNGRRRAHRSRHRAVDIKFTKKMESATSSRRLVAKTHRESRHADADRFPNRQHSPERWRMANST